jgi:hypothetical protein
VGHASADRRNSSCLTAVLIIAGHSGSGNGGRIKEGLCRCRDVDVIHGLVVKYRRDAMAIYDPIAARISKSLRASR